MSITQTPNNDATFSERSRAILRTQGIRGLTKRISSRLFREPQMARAYVLNIYLKDVVHVRAPIEDVEVRELTESDTAAVQQVADFRFYGRSVVDIQHYLANGQRCWAGKYKDQVVTCFWVQTRGFYDPYLKRRIELDGGEEYDLGAFTLPEFRGKGIIPYVYAESSVMRTRANPNGRIYAIIRVTNKSSLEAAHKVGYAIVGRIGFYEVFGIRFHYLLGRDAFPKTTRRIFLQLFDRGA